MLGTPLGALPMPLFSVQTFDPQDDHEEWVDVQALDLEDAKGKAAAAGVIVGKARLKAVTEAPVSSAVVVTPPVPQGPRQATCPRCNVVLVPGRRASGGNQLAGLVFLLGGIAAAVLVPCAGWAVGGLMVILGIWGLCTTKPCMRCPTCSHMVTMRGV